MHCLEMNKMNTRKNITILGLLAVIGIVMGGISFALADDTVIVEVLPCDGTGPLGVLNGNGFWSQLSEEQRTALYDETVLMREAGAPEEDIRGMKASMLEAWGFDAPQWSGPHVGGQGGYGKMTRDGQGNGGQFGARGAGGQGNNGVCIQTS